MPRTWGHLPTKDRTAEFLGWKRHGGHPPKSHLIHESLPIISAAPSKGASTRAVDRYTCKHVCAHTFSLSGLLLVHFPNAVCLVHSIHTRPTQTRGSRSYQELCTSKALTNAT